VQIVNWNLLKHPMNWVIVTLMVLIAGIVFHFFVAYKTGSNPASSVSGLLKRTS